MKKQYLFLLIAIGFFASAEAQFGNRSGMRGGMRGRNQSQIPQAQQKPEDIKPPTAQEILDARMPEITLAIGLNPFEEAVVSTTLVKYIQERMDIQTLKLSPEKTKEAFERIQENEDEDLKSGLPVDKYEALKKLLKEGFRKTKRERKKRERKSKN